MSAKVSAAALRTAIAADKATSSATAKNGTAKNGTVKQTVKSTAVQHGTVSTVTEDIAVDGFVMTFTAGAPDLAMLREQMFKQSDNPWIPVVAFVAQQPAGMQRIERAAGASPKTVKAPTARIKAAINRLAEQRKMAVLFGKTVSPELVNIDKVVVVSIASKDAKPGTAAAGWAIVRMV